MNKKMNCFKNIITVLTALLLLGIAAGPVSAAADIVIDNARITSSNTVAVTFIAHTGTIYSVDQTKWHIDVGDGGITPLTPTGADLTQTTSPYIITLTFSGNQFLNNSISYNASWGLYVDANGVEGSSKTNAVVLHSSSIAIGNSLCPVLIFAAYISDSELRMYFDRTLGAVETVDESKITVTNNIGTAIPVTDNSAVVEGNILTITTASVGGSTAFKIDAAGEGLDLEAGAVAYSAVPTDKNRVSLNNSIDDGQSPTVALSYSANPAKAGAMTITATYSEPIIGTPIISIDQPGSTDITTQDMANSGDQIVWTYDYTVNAATGGTYVDGTATVSLSTVTDVATNDADTPTGTSFTIDTAAPTVALSYSANPAKAGAMTITATYSEPIIGTPTISIDQPGSAEIIAEAMSGGATVWTYDYIVNTENSGAYIDGPATVSLSTVADAATNNADAPTGTTFTIDTTAPTVALTYSSNPAKAGAMTITATYSEPIIGTPTISIDQPGSADIIAEAMSGGATVWTYDYTINPANAGAYIDGTATVSIFTVADAATNNADAPTGTTFTIDTTAPTVALSYSANPAKAGAMTITATYSEPIIGTPTISIDQPGSTDITAQVMSGGATVWTYNYTVNTANAGAYIDGTATVSIFTVADAATNNADTPTGTTFTIDTTAPTVALTYSSNPAKAGTMIITATYSEPIVDTPTISIDQPGTIDITAQVMSGGATYVYTVNAVTGGTYIDGAATVSLSTVADAATNNADAPTGTNFTIDTTVPTVALSYSANPAKAGLMTITATYSEAIVGIPKISIDQPGSTDITTQDMSNSGDQIVWTYDYTVNAANGGTYIDGTVTVSLSTVADAATNNASAPTGTTFTIDTIAPTVALSYSANPAKAGSITIIASYSEPIIGIPVISIDQPGSTDITAQTMNGGSTVWTYDYTVNTATGGTYVDGTATVSLSTVADAATNNAGSPTETTFAIDTAAPTVALTYNSNPAKTGAMTITATYSEPIVGTPTISIDQPGSTDITAQAMNGGSAVWTYVYTVNTENGGTYVDGIATVSLSTVADAATNNAGSPTGTTFKIDTTTPTFTAIITDPNTIVLRFSENVDVTTTAGQGYTLSSGTVIANTDPAGSGNSITLTTSGVSGSPTVTYGAAAGTTVDTAANEVADGFNTVSSDSVAPIVSTVSSSSSNGTYNQDQTIAITLTFSEAVTVIGTPFLTLATGAINRTANYSSGNTTSTLTFNYVVRSGDNSSDLDYISTNALSLNGSTINDTSNNPATLTLPAPGTTGSLGANKDIIIDTVNLNNVNATTSRLLNISISKVANNSDKFRMNLTAKDANGNVISGATFNLISNRIQDTISPTSVTTNATGQAVFDVSSTLAGVAQITVNGTNRGFTNFTNSSVVFIAGPAFKIAIFGADRVTGLTSINQIVALQDINGNNVTWDYIGKYNISASIVSGSASITSQNPISVTNANATSVSAFGVNYTATYEKANFTLTAPLSGAGAVTFDVTSSVTGTNKTVTFYGEIISLNITTNKTSMYANNGNDSVLVTVQLKDVSGNNVQTSGVTVRLGSLTSSLFNNADIAATNTTNAKGITTFVVRSSTESGSGLIKGTVTINPEGGTGQGGSSQTITLNPAPYITNSDVVKSSEVIRIGLNSTITATIKDYNNTGVAIPDYPVTFYITRGDARFANNDTAYIATTASRTGNATALITSSNASASNLISVKVTILDENAVTKQIGSLQNFTATPGSPNQYIITPGTSIGLKNVKGTTQRFNITVKDSVDNLNLTANGTITITTNNQGLGNMSNGTTVLNNLIVTMINGNASFNYTINSTTVGTAVLTMNSSSLGIVNTTVTITTISATGIALSVNNSVQDINIDVLVSAQLTGPPGNLAISGKNISFVVTNAASVIQLVSTRVTNNSGIAAFNFTRSTAGEYTVTAYNTTLGLSNSTAVTFAGSAANIVVTANNCSPLVNTTVTINATVKDSSGVTSGSLGIGTLTFLANGTEFAQASLSSGVARTTYTKATAGAVTITAFYNATLQNTTTVIFTQEVVPALTVIALPDNVTVGRAENMTFTVTPAMSGVMVTLKGAGVNVNGTTTNRTVTITDVNATSAGTIAVTASLSGYIDGTTTITAQAAIFYGSDTIGVYQNSTGYFFLKNGIVAGVADEAAQYGPGGADFLSMVGDWNGDGTDTIGVYQISTGYFFLKNSIAAGDADETAQYGPGGADFLPMVGDWNGDGTDTIGVYQISSGYFFLKNSITPGPADEIAQYGPGGADFLPMIGDWNGDGTDTIGVYQISSGTFFLKNSIVAGDADETAQYGPGGPDFLPIVGDWNGDGTDTIGVYSISSGTFFLKDSIMPGPADEIAQYGPGGSDFLPMVGDWNGI